MGYSFKTITNVFLKILGESICKPNEIWVDKGSGFYIRSMKSFLQNNNREMYSTHNEGKSVDLWEPIDKLDDIAHKYKNTYHSTTEMKPVNVKWNTYIDSSKKFDNKNPKFKIRDIVRISKYFCKKLQSKLVWIRSCD